MLFTVTARFQGEVQDSFRWKAEGNLDRMLDTKDMLLC